MKRIVDLFCNERFIMWAIVFNTICMFLGGFWPSTRWFERTDAMFTLLFLIEAVCKISRWGWRSYWSRGWNRFDFIVLVIALPSFGSFFIATSKLSYSVLAIRSFRLLKAFRMMRFIPNIGKLLNGLKVAFRASLFVMVAFIVLLMVFSILSFTIFGRIAPELFGNPGISLYSIFRLFSIEGWYEIPEAVAANSSPGWDLFARCYFSTLMFMGGIIGLSIINSIFVDSMADDNNKEVIERLGRIEETLNKLSNKNKEDGPAL